jgi:hypothetical protein
MLGPEDDDFGSACGIWGAFGGFKGGVHSALGAHTWSPCQRLSQSANPTPA